jgi:hypothetical protein
MVSFVYILHFGATGIEFILQQMIGGRVDQPQNECQNDDFDCMAFSFGLSLGCMVIPLSSRQYKKAMQPARADTQSVRVV